LTNPLRLSGDTSNVDLLAIERNRLQLPRYAKVMVAVIRTPRSMLV